MLVYFFLNSNDTLDQFVIKMDQSKPQYVTVSICSGRFAAKLFEICRRWSVLLLKRFRLMNLISKGAESIIPDDIGILIRRKKMKNARKKK